MQNRIPCTYMRAGTSRGPFLDLRDLPSNDDQRMDVLLKIMGSPDARQIDGLGGAASVTSKVIMVQPSEKEGVDVDYLFAQVAIDKPVVDMRPMCGNMMTGVGPYAIEQGWVKAMSDKTTVRVFNINTNSYTEITVQTPGGKVNYCNGDFEIDGVPGSGAPIVMDLFEIAGGTTGKLFPTGNRKDRIDGVDVSIIDAGNLMVMMLAEDLGLNGNEDKTFFDENQFLMERLETIRLEAGHCAGMGDVSKSVLPRIGILSAPQRGGSIKSQYLTPHKLHPSHAVSGAICIATACKAKGTVAAGVARVNEGPIEQVVIEHRAGALPIQIEVTEDDPFNVVKAGTLRTARKIMDGFVYY